jgi:DNA-binding MurR/RpiR family transcriptional regulator
MDNESIIEILTSIIESLTPKTRIIASYIIDHRKEAVFLNASALAKKAGVSETTVTRLAYALGLKGFPELRDNTVQLSKRAGTIIRSRLRG